MQPILKKAFFIGLVALLCNASLPLRAAYAAIPTWRCVSDLDHLGPEREVGRRFWVTLRYEDVVDLYGFDVQLNWTTNWIHCVSYAVTVPVENYPGGILHGPVIAAKIIVDENDSIPGAIPGAMAWFAYASLYPAPVFSGSGSVVSFEFEVVRQPAFPENSTVGIYILSAESGDLFGYPITSDRVNWEIPIYGYAFNIRILDVIHAGDLCYGTNLTVAVDLVNEGDEIKTLNLTVTLNESMSKTAAITVEANTEVFAIYSWSTTGFSLGNYSITVFAEVLEGEANATDNSYEAGVVTLKVVGDVDGDMDVDILDIVLITSIYGSKVGELQFKPGSDLDHDGAITILDVVTCSGHYGRRYP